MSKGEVGYISKKKGSLIVRLPGETITVYQDGPAHVTIRNGDNQVTIPCRVLAYMDGFKQSMHRPRVELQRLTDSYITTIRQKICEIGEGDGLNVWLADYEINDLYLNQSPVVSLNLAGAYLHMQDDTDPELRSWEAMRIEELCTALKFLEKLEVWDD